MAEDFKDPRDVPWHPMRRKSLYGHGTEEARLLQALDAGKLHHAWLISGNRGIGKATLAYRFARRLLGSDKIEAHPDLFVLERAVDAKGKRLKSEIAVADARKAPSFFAHTAARGGWRVAIVDCADDLNEESANALLKVIEEPPAKCIFLLVCHKPGRLLRTIRSRCIHLRLAPLSIDDTIKVLHEINAGQGGDDHALREAAALSHGSPGRALQLIGSKGSAAFAAYLKRQRPSPAACVEIAARFTGRDMLDDFAMFAELLASWAGSSARQAALRGGGDAMARAHDDVVYSLRLADALNLDRRQAIVEALIRLDEAAAGN